MKIDTLANKWGDNYALIITKFKNVNYLHYTESSSCVYVDVGCNLIEEDVVKTHAKFLIKYIITPNLSYTYISCNSILIDEEGLIFSFFL